MHLVVALGAYLIDKVWGEFDFVKHPVVVMGTYIKWYEKRFYQDSVYRGAVLNLSLITLVALVIGLFLALLSSDILGLPSWMVLLISSLIASTTIASNMLYSSVKDIIKNPQNIQYLVSRDTQGLAQSDINKASIETYSENLSDGVIAPLFYLLLFGLEGAFVYKAINTLDSMVGYRTQRYEKFGKFSAFIDDIANYIPSRITALLIALLMYSPKALFGFYSYGKKHESPNAGHPISAMALALGIRLGGDTKYFGKLKSKPYFGEGRERLVSEDILKALSLQTRLDIFITLLLLGVIIL